MSLFKRPGRRQQHRNGAIWLGAFGSIFFLVGLGFLLLAVVPTVVDSLRMRQWEPVAAQLVDARLQASRNSEGTITHRVHATYRYVIDGQTHVGQRVAVSNQADNIGDFWYQLGWRLESAHRQGKPVTAWVNPANPTDAVLDRSLRWPLLGFWALFIAIFGGVGTGLLAWARHSWRSAAQPEHPQATTHPWMQYPEWAGPAIASNLRAERWVFTVMGVVFLGFGGVVSAIALPDAVNGRPIVWVVLLFPFFGLVMCWQAFKGWRQHRRYGAAALVLSPHPAPVGGRVVMHLDLPVPTHPQARVVMALSCLERSTSGSGKNRNTSEHLRWESEGVARLQPTGSGTRVQWQTEVPGHLPVSSPPGEDGTVWRVSVNGQGLDGDFSAHYDIPVFATGVSATFAAPEQPFAPGSADRAADEALLRERIAAVCRLEMDMQGRLVLDQPYARMRRAQLPWLIMGLVFVASGTYLWQVRAAGGLMGPLFGALGALALVLSLWLLLNRRITSLDRGQGMTMVRRFLGLTVMTRQWDAQAIEGLSLHRSYGMQVNGQRPESIWQVRAHPRQGKPVVLADSISGEEAARLLMQDIARHTGWRAAT
ncbi:MAG: DUF3592 domain-containing protein [Pseudomonadota bacterium]